MKKLYIKTHDKQPGMPVFFFVLVFLFIAGAVSLAVWLDAPITGQFLEALNLEPTSTPTLDLTLLTPTVDPNATEPLPTRRPTNTPRPTQTPLPTATLEPTATPINIVEHFLLGRPVPPDATGLIPDWTYLYGDTQHGENEVHHGEEFVNPIGTPVLAVADGTVVTAGDDKFPLCGPNGDQICGAARDYYGNLVVLRLDQTYNNQPVFALCGHMNTVGVQVGQHVQAGAQLGTVGMTGIAIGPHCHFEVRLGVNDYYHTRNPILWMRPLPGHGALAGLVQDHDGNPVHGINVTLYLDNETQDYVQDTETYGRDKYPAVNSDDHLHENWAMADLKAGKYLVSATVGSVYYLRHVTIEDGHLTFIVFGGS
jgi:murein DD-endopeptidase MepM/ murein hydrolase activator NlpD